MNMNMKEQAMVALLHEMREHYGVVGVKAEFEAEGARFNEIQRLKEITLRVGLEFALKIGGPEDVWGIHQALAIGVSDIVAPMVESAWALRKFLEAFAKHVPSDVRQGMTAAVNIETIQAVGNLGGMIRVGQELGLQSATIGRVDLVGSMDLSRKEIDFPKVDEVVREICLHVHGAELRVTLGGAIEQASAPLIESLVAEGILDRFETRKIIFDGRRGLVRFPEAIRDAHHFELLWLENKRDGYQRIADEDATRIPMLERRVRA